jgi:hypothetical protein
LQPVSPLGQQTSLLHTWPAAQHTPLHRRQHSSSMHIDPLGQQALTQPVAGGQQTSPTQVLFAGQHAPPQATPKQQTPSMMGNSAPQQILPGWRHCQSLRQQASPHRLAPGSQQLPFVQLRPLGQQAPPQTCDSSQQAPSTHGWPSAQQVAPHTLARGQQAPLRTVELAGQHRFSMHEEPL